MPRQSSTSSTSSTSTTNSSSTISSHHTQQSTLPFTSRLYPPPSYPSTTPHHPTSANTRPLLPAQTTSQSHCLNKSNDLEALSLNDLLTLDPRYDSSLSSSADPLNPSGAEEMEMPPAYEFKEEFPPDCQFEVVEICPSDDDDEQGGQREGEGEVVSRVVSLSSRADLMRIVSRIEQKGASRWWSRKGWSRRGTEMVVLRREGLGVFGS